MSGVPRPHYPWNEGDELFAAELNAAIANNGLGLAAWYDVRTFGARGDGVHLDADAINKAAAAIPSTGGVLLLPGGYTFLIDDTIWLKSGTVVMAYGAKIVAHTTWRTPVWHGVNLGFSNVNYLAAVITDHDISILGGYYDWSSRSADHIVNMRCVRNTVVRDIRTLGSGVAIEHMHCDTTLVDHCYVEAFVTDGIDHFDSPRNAIVRDCTVRTTNASQMVTFNAVDVNSAAGSGDGFLMEGCFIESTENPATPCQLEPLPAASGTGNMLKNVKVHNNTFRNSWLVCRGNCQNFSITDNSFEGFLGAVQAIVFGADPGGSGATPDGVMIARNTVKDSTATTTAGVIQLFANNWTCVFNRIIGAGYTAPGMSSGAFPGVFFGNEVGTGLVSMNIAVDTGDFGFQLQNGQNLAFLNSARTWHAKIGLQSDNNLVITGISSTGSDRVIATIAQNSDTSDWKFLPAVTLASTAANAIRVAGGAAGNTPQIFALGSDTDVYLSLKGQGARGVKGTGTTKVGIPGTGDLAVGEWGIYKDSSGGGVSLAYNDAGTIKKVALT